MQRWLGIWTALWVMAIGPAVADSGGSPPGAYELLERVRDAYQRLPAYRDLGEIRVVRTMAGVEHRSSQWFTTAASSDGRFRWELVRRGALATERRVLWRTAEGAFLYDSGREQVKPVASPAAELVHGFGDGGFEALAVAIFAAGHSDALAEPEAASVDGPVACDAGECWILTISRMSGTITSELWVDRQSLLVQRVEVELLPASAVLAAAGEAAGLGGREPRSRSPRQGPTRVSVFHRVVAEPVTAESLDFQPPVGTLRVETWTDPTGAMIAADEEEGGLPPFGFVDEITVSLLTVDARIVARSGEPIAGLSPQDLRVRVGSSELAVTAVDWVPASSSEGSSASNTVLSGARFRTTADPRAQTDHTRSVVILVQADVEPLVVQGHVKILPSLRELIAGLPADDRIAIAAYYRRLEVMQDLTRDRQAVSEVLGRAFRPGATPVPKRGDGQQRSSLRAHLDASAAREAASPERALELIASALAEIPGDKLVIFVGWSIGHFRPGEGVAPDEHYAPALQALDSIRAPVFVLDVMDAAWHALEFGLQGIAEQTGGSYLKTSLFPSQATRRLSRMISGYYRVTIDRGQPPLPVGRLRIDLRNHRGSVLFRPVVLR